jgi:hypothetical protein
MLILHEALALVKRVAEVLWQVGGAGERAVAVCADGVHAEG